MSVIHIPRVLVERLSEKGAQALVHVLNELEDNSLTRSLQAVEGRFETRLAQMETRLVKWMFLFVFGQFWMIVGTLFVFFK